MSTDPLIPTSSPFSYGVGINYESWEVGRTGYSITKDLNQISDNFHLIRTYHDAAVGTSTVTIDPTQAKASGLPVGWLHYGLLVALSLTIVAALKAVGIILAIALLIAPGATAFLLTRRFGAMLATAVGIALLCALAGTYASFWIDSAPAPTIVLAMTLCFIAAFILTVARSRRASTPLAPEQGAP